MDIAAVLNILSASGGMAGTWLLYKGSFAYEAPPVYMNQDLVNNMVKRNKRRQMFQRSGLGFLFVGFLLQCVSQLVVSWH